MSTLKPAGYEDFDGPLTIELVFGNSHRYKIHTRIPWLEQTIQGRL